MGLGEFVRLLSLEVTVSLSNAGFGKTTQSQINNLKKSNTYLNHMKSLAHTFFLLPLLFLSGTLSAQFFGGAGSGGGSNQSSPAIPLPVSYTFFNAIPLQQSPRLSKITWATSSEINNSHFEVEWLSTSTDTWEQVGMIASQGHSYGEQHYEFIHPHPSSFNMYRLKQVDWDGNYSYSPVRTVRFDYTDPTPHARLYPNPTQDKFTLKLEGAMEGQFALYDAMGKLIEKGICQGEQSFSGLAAGVYHLRIQLGEIVETKRIVVAQ
jgi:hypothetical protein